MPAGDLMRAVGRQLFEIPNANAFAVLDGASVPALLDGLHRHEPEHVCLFPGDLEPDMAEVAPYLVQLAPEHDFTRWVIEEGWGNHWGIFAVAPADLRHLRRHLRQFLTVEGPAGKPLYFRFYDPRVLRTYLPTCNADETRLLFGPVSLYVMEGEDPNVLVRFALEQSLLRREETRLVLS